ncbi:MAG: hypothetical protein IRZ08_16480 [Frankia sp.]|nr:hypothetical protein [Frankia sp.]
MTEPEPGPAGHAGPDDAGVRAAAERLAALPGLPVADHVAVFEDVHRLLAGTLAGLDAAADAPGSTG